MRHLFPITLIILGATHAAIAAYPHSAPNDPGYAGQYGLKASIDRQKYPAAMDATGASGMAVDKAWADTADFGDASTGSPDVVIGFTVTRIYGDLRHLRAFTVTRYHLHHFSIYGDTLPFTPFYGDLRHLRGFTVTRYHLRDFMVSLYSAHGPAPTHHGTRLSSPCDAAW